MSKSYCAKVSVNMCIFCALFMHCIYSYTVQCTIYCARTVKQYSMPSRKKSEKSKKNVILQLITQSNTKIPPPK